MYFVIFGQSATLKSIDCNVAMTFILNNNNNNNNNNFYSLRQKIIIINLKKKIIIICIITYQQSRTDNDGFVSWTGVSCCGWAGKFLSFTWLGISSDADVNPISISTVGVDQA